MSPTPDTILAIDLGTSGPKVALFSDRGEVIAHARADTALDLGPNGKAEQNPDDWWRAIVQAAREIRSAAPDAMQRTVAVVVTAQWLGTVAIDKEGRPVRPALTWLDSRGARYAQQLVGGFPSVSGYQLFRLYQWLSKTGGVPSPTGKDPVGHILFMKNDEPALFERTWKFVEPVDYLGFRLTGVCASTPDAIAAHWSTDNRDLSNVRYVPSLLSLVGISEDKLPELQKTGSLLGPVLESVATELGISPGAQVVMGTADYVSASLGAGTAMDLEPHLYIGTSAWVSCHVPYKKTDLLNSITTLPAGIPGSYLVATTQDCAGASLDFAAKVLGSPALPFPEMEALACDAARNAQSPMFFPWLNGERTPVEDANIRGGFTGFGLGTTRGDLAYAAYEGVALNTRWMHGTVEKFTGQPLDEVRFIGGGAQSPFLAQLLADALGRRIQVTQAPRLSNARGAALLASMAIGRVQRSEIRSLVPVDREYSPDPARSKELATRFARFVDYYKRNRTWFTPASAV